MTTLLERMVQFIPQKGADLARLKGKFSAEPQEAFEQALGAILRSGTHIMAAGVIRPKMPLPDLTSWTDRRTGAAARNKRVEPRIVAVAPGSAEPRQVALPFPALPLATKMPSDDRRHMRISARQPANRMVHQDLSARQLRAAIKAAQGVLEGLDMPMPLAPDRDDLSAASSTGRRRAAAL
jgi:hypothetical protein